MSVLKTITIRESLYEQWQRYKVSHPDVSLSGYIGQALTEKLEREDVCASDATLSTTK